MTYLFPIWNADINGSTFLDISGRSFWSQEREKMHMKILSRFGILIICLG